MEQDFNIDGMGAASICSACLLTFEDPMALLSRLDWPARGPVLKCVAFMIWVPFYLAKSVPR